MEQFFNTFYDGYNKTKEPKYTILKLNNDQSIKQKNRLLMEDHFISDPIKNKIKNFNNCYKIECLSKLQEDFYPYNSNKYMPCIEIYYFTKNKNNNNNNIINQNNIINENNKALNKKIKPILRRLFFISNLYSKLSRDSTPVKCWICPTHLKKLLPKYNKYNIKNKILGPNEVNSGLSIPSHREIVLWRDEELNKVLLHELIHTYKLDEKLYQTSNLKNYVYNTINVSKNTEINPNETYTESLAILLNTIFNMIDKNSNSISTKDLYKKYINQINKEVDFSTNQTSKILLYNGYTNINDLFRENNKNNVINANKYQYNHQWKQNTNVLSYYILKNAIIYNLKHFIDYLKNTNNLYVNNSDNFINILNKSLDNKAFINKINNRIKKIKNKKYKNNNIKNSIKNNYSNISLRMSSI